MTKSKKSHKPYVRGSFIKQDYYEKQHLYENSVQDTKQEVKNLLVIYREMQTFYDGPPKIPTCLREDFCGSGILAIEWASMGVLNISYGLDIDQSIIFRARNNINNLHPNVENRVVLYQGNVLSEEHDPKPGCEKTVSSLTTIPKCDALVALNYGVLFFKTRSLLVRYFGLCKNRLQPNGVFICDVFGGQNACLKQNRLVRKCEEFEYYFEVIGYDFVNNILRGGLNYKLKDGTWIERAYTYEFRMYSIVEIKEALLEAGFKYIKVWYSKVLAADRDMIQEEYNNKKNFELIDQLNFNGSQDDYWNAYVAASL